MHRGARGFTLSEILIATLILVVSGLVVLALLPNALQAQHDARLKMFTAMHAQTLLNGFYQHEYEFKGWAHNRLFDSGPSWGGIERSLNQDMGDIRRAGGPTDQDLIGKMHRRHHLWLGSTLRYNLENFTTSAMGGLYPVPLSIARRLDSPGDEIARILDGGGHIFYLDPEVMRRNDAIARSSAEKGKESPLLRLICGVVGDPQQNLLPGNPAAQPIYEHFPFPPLHHVLRTGDAFIYSNTSAPIPVGAPRTYNAGDRYRGVEIPAGQSITVQRYKVGRHPASFWRGDMSWDSLSNTNFDGMPRDADDTRNYQGWETNTWEFLARLENVEADDFYQFRPNGDPGSDDDFDPVRDANRWADGIDAYRRLCNRHWQRIQHQVRYIVARLTGSGGGGGPSSSQVVTVTKWRPVRDPNTGAVLRDIHGNPVMESYEDTETVSVPAIPGGDDWDWRGGNVAEYIGGGNDDARVLTTYMECNGWPKPAIGHGSSTLRGTDILEEDAYTHWYNIIDRLRRGMPSLERRIMYRSAALALWAAVLPDGPKDIRDPVDHTRILVELPDGTVSGDPRWAGGLPTAAQLDLDGDGSLIDEMPDYDDDRSGTVEAGEMPDYLAWTENPCNPDFWTGYLEPRLADMHPAQIWALSHVAHAAMMVTGYQPPFYDEDNYHPERDPELLVDTSDLHADAEWRAPYKAVEPTCLHDPQDADPAIVVWIDDAGTPDDRTDDVRHELAYDPVTGRLTLPNPLPAAFQDAGGLARSGYLVPLDADDSDGDGDYTTGMTIDLDEDGTPDHDVAPAYDSNGNDLADDSEEVILIDPRRNLCLLRNPYHFESRFTADLAVPSGQVDHLPLATIHTGLGVASFNEDNEKVQLDSVVTGIQIGDVIRITGAHDKNNGDHVVVGVGEDTVTGNTYVLTDNDRTRDESGVGSADILRPTLASPDALHDFRIPAADPDALPQINDPDGWGADGGEVDLAATSAEVDPNGDEDADEDWWAALLAGDFRMPFTQGDKIANGRGDNDGDGNPDGNGLTWPLRMAAFRNNYANALAPIPDWAPHGSAGGGSAVIDDTRHLEPGEIPVTGGEPPHAGPAPATTVGARYFTFPGDTPPAVDHDGDGDDDYSTYQPVLQWTAYKADYDVDGTTDARGPIPQRPMVGEEINAFAPPYADRGAIDLGGRRRYAVEYRLQVEWLDADGEVTDDPAARVRPRYRLLRWFTGHRGAGTDTVTNADRGYAAAAHENCLQAVMAYVARNPYDLSVPRPMNRPAFTDRGLYAFDIFDVNGVALKPYMTGIQLQSGGTTYDLTPMAGVTFGLSCPITFPDTNPARFGAPTAPMGQLWGNADYNFQYMPSHAGSANQYWVPRSVHPLIQKGGWPPVSNDRSAMLNTGARLHPYKFPPLEGLGDDRLEYGAPLVHPDDHWDATTDWEVHRDLDGDGNDDLDYDHIYHGGIGSNDSPSRPDYNPFWTNDDDTNRAGFRDMRQYAFTPLAFNRAAGAYRSSKWAGSVSKWPADTADLGLPDNGYPGDNPYYLPRNYTWWVNALHGYDITDQAQLDGWQTRALRPERMHVTDAWEANERTRQLVYWTANWQAYEDCESAPGVPVDASRVPIDNSQLTLQLVDGSQPNIRFSVRPYSNRPASGSPCIVHVYADGSPRRYWRLRYNCTWFGDGRLYVSPIDENTMVSAADAVCESYQEDGVETFPVLDYDGIERDTTTDADFKVLFKSLSEEIGSGCEGVAVRGGGGASAWGLLDPRYPSGHPEYNFAWMDPEHTATRTHFDESEMSYATIHGAGMNSAVYFPPHHCALGLNANTVFHWAVRRSRNGYCPHDLEKIAVPHCVPFGADRNGDGEYTRGHIPPTTRMQAKEVARYNFYDPVVFLNMKQ